MRKFVLILALALPVVVKAQKADTLQRLTPYQLESLQKSGQQLRDGSNEMMGGLALGLVSTAIGAYVATKPGIDAAKNRKTGGIIMGAGVVLGVGIGIGGANKVAGAGRWLKNLWRTSKPKEQIDYENSQNKRKK